MVLNFLFFGSISAKELEKVSLQLQWLDQFQFAGYYMAKEKGFYKDVGLDVEIRKFNNIRPAEEVNSKKATYGVSHSSLIIDKSNGKDIKLLSAIFQSSPAIVLALKDSKIKTIEDFKNKKMVTTEDFMHMVSVHSMINKHGIASNEIIEQKSDFYLDDLINKKTELIMAYISNEPFRLNEKKVEFTIFDPKDYGFDFYDDILFTHSDEVKNHKQRTIDFNNASLKGWEYAFAHIDETVELILKKYNSQNKSKQALVFEANELKKLAYHKTEELGHIEPSQIQRIFDIYNVMGVVKNKIDLDAFIFKNDTNRLITFTNEEIAYLKEHKTIRAHNEKNWRPFNFNEKDKPQGYSIDYMNLLAQKLDVKVEYVSGPSWNDFLNMIKTNELDVILNIVKTKERETFLSFTPEYSKHIHTIYSRNDDKYSSFQNLEGKTIAEVKGFASIELLKQDYPKIKILEVDSAEEIVKAVYFGNADAFISIPPVVNAITKELHITNIIPSGEAKYLDNKAESIDLSIATSKDNRILRDILEKAQGVITNQEMQELDSKWFGTELKSTTNTIVLTQQEKEHLKNKKEITMCVDPNRMPFEKIENGKHLGMTSGYFKLMGEKIGTPIKLIPTDSWSQSIEFAKARKCDIFSLAIETVDQKEYMNFTKPYIIASLTLTTKINTPFINNMQDVLGKKLGATKGYSYIEVLKKKYPNIVLREYETLKDGLDAVVKGEIFGLIDNHYASGYAIQTDYMGVLKIAGKLPETLDLSVEVRNDDLVLLDIFNKAISNISQQEQTILNHWMATIIEQEHDYTYVWKVSALFLFVLLVIVYFLILQYKLNKKLQTTQENFALGQKIASFGIWVLDYGTQELNWTSGVHNIFQTDAKSFKPSYNALLEMVHIDDRDLLHNAYETSIKEKTDYFIEHRIVVNKEIKYLEERCQNFFDKNGKIKKSIGTVLDITQEKLLKIELSKTNHTLKEQRDAFQSLYLKSTDGIIIIKDGYFIDCNDAIVKLLKYNNRDEFLGLHPSDLSPKFQPDGQDSFLKANKMMQIAIETGTNTFEWIHVNATGEEFWTEVVLTQMIQNKESIIHVVWRDISQRKETELELEHLRENLESRVEQELAKNRLKDQQMLQQSKLAQMGEMIAMIAHQWRQPLNAISLTSGNLQLKLMMGDIDKEYFAKEIELIDGYSQHLSKTIDDFRGFFREDKIKANASLENIVNETLSIIQISAETKNIKIITEFDCDVEIETYPNEVKQVVLNIIKNAEDILLEMNIENPTITIRTLCDTESGTKQIIIKDNAGGIPEDIIDKIFDPYFSTKLEKDGTGLGLYMSKNIIEEHCGGKLSVTNDELGAVFVIELEVAKSGGGKDIDE